MSDDQVAVAQARSDRARDRLADALAALKQRLLPKTIARNLVHGLGEKGSDAAKASAEAVRAKPGVAVGVAAIVTLFLARKPIIRSISSADQATDDLPERSPD